MPNSSESTTLPRPLPISPAGSRVSPPPTGSVWRIERALLRRLLAALGSPPLTIVLWNGEHLHSGSAPRLARLRIHDRPTLWKLMTDPSFQFGETYMHGGWDVEGDVVGLLAAIFRGFEQGGPMARWFDFWSFWLHWPRGNSLGRSRDNIYHHYDIGNDFYQLWLDEQLVYTCAYFAEPSYSLEQAQLAKLDHVCRKLRLRPGEKVLEAGCGWGSLALHMAEHYGVQVEAYNISHEQIAFAKQQAYRRGLQDQVEFIEDDWRNMRSPCDAFVSVGMLEHVGPKNYRKLGEVIKRCLKPEGRGLLHSIGRNWPLRSNPWIERRIFPGGYTPSLREMLQVLEPYGFSVLDVENLRLHYAETLRHWLERFEASAETVRDMFDERFVRMWRMYLGSSAAAFEAGSMQLFQVLFAQGSTNRVPMTRAELYR